MRGTAAAGPAKPPPRADAAVRLPGEHGLRRRRDGLAAGVVLNAGIVPALQPWAERHGVALPTAVAPPA